MPLPIITSPMTLLPASWRSALLRGRRWGLAALTVITLFFGIEDVQDNGISASTILGVISPWALLFSKRSPCVVASLLSLGTVYTLATNQFSATIVSTWLAICIMLRVGRRPQVLTMVGAIGAGMVLCGIRGQPVQVHLIINAIGLLISSSVALTLRAADRRLEDAAVTRAEALRAQRALIARELHDTLARANTQMVLRAQQAKAQLGDPERADQVAAALEDIVAVGHQSVTDLRTMLRVLREENAVATGTAPLSADLPGALERAEHDLRAAGLRPTLACEGDASSLAPFLATTMARILDEAVANMIKYAARGARCSVQLDVDDEQVGLLVINPLAGNRRATPATSSGLGLLGIRERAQAHGGGADVISDDRQWILHVTIPLNASVPSTP